MAAMCLEDALPSHPQLREVHLTENPLGEEGFRAVFRGMLRGRSKLEFVDCTKLRDSTSKPTVSFSFSDLTESYTGSHALHCELPYHRSVLRLILRRVEDFNQPASACLQHLLVDGHKVDRLPFKKERSGSWHVPSTGKVEFQLVLPHPSGAKTGDELIDMWQRVRRLRIATTKFVHFHRLLASMESDFEFSTLVEMIARDCLLKNVHLKLLTEVVAEVKPKLIPSILPHLVLAIPKVDRACINSSLVYLSSNSKLCDSPVLSTRLQQNSLIQLKEILRFNAGNPNGRYELTLSNPMQYAVAERIFTLNAWEAEQARRKGRLDTSQAGHYDAIRNFRFNGIMKLHDMEWELPGDGYVGDGNLVFDYVTPLLPPARSKPLHTDLFEHICSVLRKEGTDISEPSRYSAIRLVAHLFYLTARQLCRVVKTFEDEHRRIDLYCELYCRCCEFGAPLVDVHEGTLSEKVFRWEERCIITARLGLVNTVDWLHLHYDPAHWTDGERRHRVALCGNALKAKPRNRYTFDLTKHDDHVLASLILKLAEAEPGLNILNPTWTHSLKTSIASTKWSVPSSWMESGIPRKGVFEMTYVLEKPSCLSVKVRQEYAAATGWVKMAPSVF